MDDTKFSTACVCRRKSETVASTGRHNNASHLPFPPRRSSSKPPTIALSRQQDSDFVTVVKTFRADVPPSSYLPMLKNGGVVAAPDNIHDSDSDSDGDDGDISSPTSTIVPPSPVSSRSPSLANLRATSDGQDLPSQHGDAAASERPSTLHPRVAVILGVDRRWYVPLLICRALSVVPAAWWGLRCAFTFLAELLRIRPGMWREGWVAAVVGSNLADWDVERRFRVTEVALAIMWVCFWRPLQRGKGFLTEQFQCCASAYLSYFFMDCMMSRWLVYAFVYLITQKAMTSLTYEQKKKGS